MILQDRWNRFSFAQQMGHIASEIARARHLENKAFLENRNQSIERALDLIDLTIESQKERDGLKEILRFREMVCDWYVGSGAYSMTPEMLENYCLSIYSYQGETSR